MNGMKQDVNGTPDGKTRLVNAFQNLIKLAYPNLKMLGSTQFSEDTIKAIIRDRQDDLFGTDDTTMSEAESEVLNIIHRRKKMSERTSLTDIRDHFAKKPYGWYQNAVFSIAAKLYKRGKVELSQDSNLLDDDGALNAFMNNRLYSNTLLEPQVDYDPRLIKQLMTVYSDYFDESCPAKEAKEVAIAFKGKLTQELGWLNQMLMSKENYPFLKVLEPVAEFVEKLTKKEYNYYLTNVSDFEDDLLDHKEKTVDPIKRFWHGEQKKIYDGIRGFFSGNQSNLEYIECEELDVLREVNDHETPFYGNLIRDAKLAKDTLTKKVLAQIEQERKLTEAEINHAINRIQSHDDFKALDDLKREQVLKPFEDEAKKVKEQRFIANLRETQTNVKGKLLEQQLNLMAQLANPIIEPDKPVYRNINNVKVEFPKNELKTKEDVEKYVDALKAKLNELINDNKRISL
jgi:predicted transcriptional regulator